jgi:L-fucose mutarotase
MLHNISPILSPDILHTLRAMGHGDEIVIGDANFPGTSMGKRCHRLDGISATDLLEAIVQLFPIDTFDDAPLAVMEVVGDPSNIPPIVGEFQEIIDKTADNPAPIKGMERFKFYERASNAFAVIQTGETRIYGNIILKKGVIS